jgi:hypothetical protein
MKTLIFTTSLLIACNALRADDSTSAGAKAAVWKRALSKAGATAEAAPVTSTYTPKRKSVFTASAEQHNPFWPIGWVKIEEGADSSAPVVPHAENFSVTTILLNEPPMAVINGKDMAEGEVAEMPIDGQNVAVQLMAVQDGRVILRWQNQNIVVPIHREEQLSGVADTAEPATAQR